MYLPTDIRDGMIRSLPFTGQDSGWMTQRIFLGYVKDMLIPEVQRRRRADQLEGQRAALFVDGHSSRSSAEAMDALSAAGIDCITPVAHSSHISQALDLHFLMTFKQALSGLSWKIATDTLPNSAGPC